MTLTIPSFKKPHSSGLALLAGLMLSGSASAAFIAGISVQSADTGSNPNMSPSDAIDGQGLPGNTPALTGTHSTTWTHHWWSAQTDPQITIDLGTNYSLDTIQIWNYNEGGQNARGLQDVEIYVSPDDNPANLVKLITDDSGTHDDGNGDFTLPQAPSLTSYTGFNLDLTSITNASLLDNARLVQIQGVNTYGSTGGLAEVQFGGGAPVPEPSSALLGLGGLALILRRRLN